MVAIGKKSVVDHSESDILDDELSKEDKVLMVSNLKKLFKKNFSRFGNKFKQGNSSYEKSKTGELQELSE